MKITQKNIWCTFLEFKTAGRLPFRILLYPTTKLVILNPPEIWHQKFKTGCHHPSQALVLVIAERCGSLTSCSPERVSVKSLPVYSRLRSGLQFETFFSCLYLWESLHPHWPILPCDLSLSLSPYKPAFQKDFCSSTWCLLSSLLSRVPFLAEHCDFSLP